ncbi:hypothetical protein ACN4EG_17165 [Alkalinema pantanalense CENA528]|uniref:hypothetical protein n=1 Tax=Alkalinema pantanalense TaxID=1620705 RepID=UPI003D6F2498
MSPADASPSALTKRSDSPGIISPTSPLEFLGFAAINALIGLISNANPIGLIAVPLIAAGWWLYDRQRQREALRLRGLSLTKEIPQPAKGLILLVSPYSPRSQTPAATTIAAGIEKIMTSPTVNQTDFEAINFSQSNQQPQLNAIDYHYTAGTLQEVWLLSSPDSAPTAQLLQRYLDWKYQHTITIHRKPPIFEYDYEQIFQVTNQIFRESPFKEELLIADITGGTKMMSVAIAMACIAPKRRMQYIDMAEQRPVRLDVEPIFYGREI